MSMTRLDSSHDFWWLGLHTSHVEKNGDSTGRESRSSRNDSTQPESQSITRNSSQSCFYKISEFLMDEPSSFAQKEMIIFCFSGDQIGGNFLFSLSSRGVQETECRSRLRPES